MWTSYHCTRVQVEQAFEHVQTCEEYEKSCCGDRRVLPSDRSATRIGCGLPGIKCRVNHTGCRTDGRNRRFVPADETTGPNVRPVPKPQSWLQYPSQFGYVKSPQWKPASRVQEPDLAAARNQHEFARDVRDQKHHHGITDADIARDLGLTVNHVGRYLRGEVAIPTLIMHRIAHAVGLRLTITLAPTEE